MLGALDIRHYHNEVRGQVTGKKVKIKITLLLIERKKLN